MIEPMRGAEPQGPGTVDRQAADATEPPAGAPAGTRPIGPARRLVRRLAGPFARPARPRWTIWAPLPVALGLWLVALSGVHLERMGTLGLLQALPPLYWAAVLLLTLGFVATLRAPRVPHGWAAGYVVGLIAVIHATPTLLYPTLRYAWAWKHVAVIDAMMRHNGSVPGAHDMDVYDQWPGFFQLNALFLRATGLHSALGYAAWYPVLANLLLMGPLLLIYRTFTQDRRLLWGGVWLYFATAWVGQDYFAPQAFAYFLFLTVLALVLRQLAGQRAPGAPPPDPGASPPDVRGARALTGPPGPRRFGWRPVPFALLMVLVAAIVCSHPLTPLMMISFLLILSLPRRNRRVVLPVLAGAVALTFLWDATVARPYISSNLNSLISALGSPDQNALPNLSRLGTTAHAQVIASWVDRGLTVTVILLAVLALLRHRWTRRTPLPWLLVAPLPLLLSNNYGGEMIFRAYLFALPAAAFLVATLLVSTRPRPRLGSWIATGVSTAVMLALLAGLFVGYYSKETMNYFTPDEAAATRYLANVPANGALVVSVTGDLPGGEMRYDQRQRIVLSQGSLADRRALLADPKAALEATMGDPRVTGPAYLVLTRAQAADCALTGLFPADTVQRVNDAAASAPEFVPVYSGHDAVVYRYAPVVNGAHLYPEVGQP
ncbi:glycosyltransferase [Kitasatospora sp. NPDC094015]|uniref:glycosyltransferase n=1 Tax=Kitasatospora sp. NPDC094015 TaxID=3155205 RepID=UPI00331E72AE